MLVLFRCIVVAFVSVFFLRESCADNANNNDNGVDILEYDGIVAVVNDEIITTLDLNDRIRLVLLFLGQERADAEKSRIRSEVLAEMIDEKLKEQCLKKFAPKEGWLPERDLNDAINNTLTDMARQVNKTLPDFVKFLNAHGIEMWTVAYQINIGICWSEYIRARFGKNVNISESELSRLYASMRERFTQESYCVRRMFFPVSKPSEENAVLTKANNLLDILRRGGADFGNLARQFSKSAEARNGGELGWVFREQLSPEEEKVLQTMPIGSYGMAKNRRGYFILFLQDRRESGTKSITNLKLVQLVVPFPMEHPSGDVVDNVMNFVDGLLKTSRNANELIAHAKESEVAAVSDQMSTVLEGMDPRFRNVLSNVPANGFSRPIRTENGILIICVMDKQVSSLHEPSRSDIKIQKMNEKLAVLAEAEIQGLKKKAVIRIKKKYQ
ncbi:MAG: peptidylprolyl isomerase [Holosporaceae bacterium]|jgi:peptidyl-prolyl cis-trans isomerase SurA|nr:peptidylprolyl isomerase [Holosporaceae bacterium]